VWAIFGKQNWRCGLNRSRELRCQTGRSSRHCKRCWFIANYESRPVGSRLGAWASPQSQPTTREALEANEHRYREQFGDDPPRPPHWGGYRLVPHALEFWQGRPSRLHDRLRYRLTDGQWVIERLAP